MGIKEIRKKQIKDAGVVSDQIRTKFERLSISTCTKTERLFTDLGDIHEICEKYLALIKLLLAETTGREHLHHIIKNIYNEIYIHLDYHVKGMKKPLRLFLDQPVSRLEERNPTKK